MADLVLHPVTARTIEEFVLHPAHAVVLTGPTGSGKGSVAAHMASKILQLDGQDIQQYPYLRLIEPTDGKAISIDTIRELQSFMSLKVPGSKPVARIAIIEAAHRLTLEAQNALLKTLEEPPEDSMLVLTVSYLDALLPTIQSRVTVLPVIQPPADQLREHYREGGYEAKQIDKSLLLTGGLPGLMYALLSSQEDHQLYKATELARSILQGKTFDRLLLVDSVSKQKDLAVDAVFMLGQMARAALMRGSGGKDDEQRWISILKASEQAAGQLQQNVQAKLVMTNLMLSL